MVLFWRYAVLALGIFGTLLALLIFWVMITPVTSSPELPWIVRALLAATMLCGLAQWVVFLQRRYRLAATMFIATPLICIAAFLALGLNAAGKCDEPGPCVVTVEFRPN